MSSTATAPARPLTPKEKLRQYREAARTHTNTEWGDQKEAAKESRQVHEAYGKVRKEANRAKINE